MTGLDLPEPIRRAAQAWIVRLHSGAFSQADADALNRWRDEDPMHRQAFAEASASWEVVRAAAERLAAKQSVEKKLAEDARASAANVRRVPSRRVITRRVMLGGAIAASAVYAVVHPPLDLWPSLSELTADYRTTTGEQREIAVSGHVSVELNTRTSLAIRSRDKDGVELIDGEIAVTARPAGAPFVVVAGDGRASAEQAVFDLRSDAGRVMVTCIDGAVRVECRGAAETLRPRQQIAYDHRGLSAIAAVDAAVVDAWRRGLLVFENVPVTQVIAEINRYRRGKIILMDASLGRLPLDASFRLDRIDEAVDKIAHVFGARVKSLPGGIVLLG
jgi:transmembrane sensor